MNEPQIANPQMAGTISSRKQCILQIAIVIPGYDVKDSTLWAVASPLTSCRITTLVTLTPQDESDKKESQAARATAWLEEHRISSPESVKLLLGDEGFEKMLLSDSIDAVYILLSGGPRHDTVVKALQGNKHVLLNDPIKTSHSDFVKEIAVARQVNRYIQFSATFVHHTRVKAFLDFVLDDSTFGKIESIKTTLRVNYKELEKIDLNSADHSLEGIQILARYSVLISALILSRASPCHPVAAKLNHMSKPGEPLSGQGTVLFSNGAKLTWKAAATTAPTRQILEVQAARRYASVTDFVIPHPDGLATFRVYDQAINPITGKFEVDRGESLDIPSGAPHDIMMWRRFSANCQAIAQTGWTGDSAVAHAQEETLVSLQTRRVLAAISESAEKSFSEVAVLQD